MSIIKSSAKFERKNVDHTQENVGHLILSLSAEDKDFERTPISTILVLDVSGSMGGHCGKHGTFAYGSGSSKIAALKETARKLVEHISDQDEVGIVTFTDVAEVVAVRQSGSNKEALYAAIDRLSPLASTNMSAGVMQAFEQINIKFKGVRRIMLLSDGLPNVGVQDTNGLVDMVGSRPDGSTLSTFGFGTDCDQDLLASMAKAGEGNYYFIEDANDLRSTFARELGGALSCVAQNIEIKVKPNKGVEIGSVLNDYTVEDDNGSAIIKAEDIYSNETKHILVEMTLGKVARPKDRDTSLAHVEVSYDNLKTHKRESKKLNPKVRYTKPAKADKDAIVEVAEQVAMLKAAKAHEEAVKLANQGNFVASQNLLRSVSADLDNVGTVLCDQASIMNTAMVENFKDDTYDASYGSTVTASANSSKRMRAGTKGLSDLYITKGAEAMEDKFKDPSGSVGDVVDQSTTDGSPDGVKPSITPVDADTIKVVGPCMPPDIQWPQAPPAVSPKDKNPKDNKKGFAKKRSRSK